MQWHRHALAVAAGLLCSAAQVTWAQNAEPNDTCAAAENAGAYTAGTQLDGTLDRPGFTSEVDFLRFTGTPGQPVVVDLRGSTDAATPLRDPYLGLFDGNCNLLAINDDFMGFNSHLEFEVPSDGAFVLAVASCCDSSFMGFGNSSGAYSLLLTDPPPSIGSITGRVTDAFTGDALAGGAEPFARVSLIACQGDTCFNNVASTNPDALGQFRFERDFSGRRLPAGTYQIVATANEFQRQESVRFSVGDREDFDLGDLGLVPPPIRFGRARPCGAILPQGGVCRYTVRINNNTAGELRGTVWSIVDGTSTGGPVGLTSFEASTTDGDASANRAPVAIRSRATAEVSFQFTVPSFAPNGATFCTRAFFGYDPNPLVNTGRQGFLFCMQKGDNGFTPMSTVESQGMFEMLGGVNHTTGAKPAK